jgi:uncharacterized protein DUF4286
MVAYEVTMVVQPALIEACERYMRERHIPDVLSTGCFRGADLARQSPGRYRVRYLAATEADLERYLQIDSPRLRKDFAAYFPKGVTLSREVWTALQTWDV